MEAETNILAPNHSLVFYILTSHPELFPFTHCSSIYRYTFRSFNFSTAKGPGDSGTPDFNSGSC